MPYITPDQRPDLVLGIELPDTPGTLNFKLTTICLDYLNLLDESYSTYNDIVGALECCKLEFYRRKIAKYEKQCIARNGDIF